MLPARPAENATLTPASRQIGARAIRRGILLNALGAGGPAVAAVLVVPGIVAGLGNARFGVLSLAWIFINSVGVLDLGIGRALTRFLAVREEPDPAREAATIWTSLAATLALGLAGAAAVFALADPIAARLAHGDLALRADTAGALAVLALSVPSVMLSSVLRGVLEAFGRFDLTNRVTIPVTLLNLLLPAALLHLGASLLPIVAALVVVRLAGTLLLLGSVLRVLPALATFRLRLAGMLPVLAFGGWVTVAFLPAPLLAQGERYLLGSLATLSAVAFYATPADVLARVTVIPGAVLQVLFPVLAQALQVDRARAARLASRALLLVVAAALPVLTVLVAVAPEALAAWLGPEFARHGARAARVVALVTFLNCMDWLAFSLVQSSGRAGWTGRLRAAELPLQLAVTAALIHAAGVEGAALAALLRALVDGTALVVMAARVLGPGARFARLYGLLAAGGAATLAGAAAPLPLAARLGWSVLALGAGAAGAWRLLDGEAREALSARVAQARAWVGSVAS